MSAATSALDMRLRARLDSIRQSMQPRETPSSFASLPSDLALSMPMSSLAFERNVERPSALIAVQTCPRRGATSSGDAVPMVHLCWMVGVGIAIAAALILYLRRGKKQCERELRKTMSRKRMHPQSSPEPDSSDDDDDDDNAAGVTVLPVVSPHAHHHHHRPHNGDGVTEYEDIPQRVPQPPRHPPQYQQQPHTHNQELLTSSQGSSFTF